MHLLVIDSSFGCPYVEVGQIVAFETAATSANAGKKGFFKVMEITGTSGLDRTITIEVKIQK